MPPVEPAIDAIPCDKEDGIVLAGVPAIEAVAAVVQAIKSCPDVLTSIKTSDVTATTVATLTFGVAARMALTPTSRRRPRW